MHVNLLFKKIAALIPCLLLTVALNAQTVTKAFRSVPLKTVLEEVERQTGYSILFENEDVDGLSHSIPYPARAGQIKKGLTRRSSRVILLARKFVSGRGEIPHWRYSPRPPARVLTR